MGQLGFDKVGNSFKIIMLPYFVTVTLLIAQAFADANILIPNAYYAGNVAGYSGYTSPYFSYQHRYPTQQSQVRTYSTSPRNTFKRVRTYSTFTTSPSNTLKRTYSHRNTHKVRTYPIFQYNTRSIYQQPQQQYNYNTVTNVVKNDPYAANPHVTKIQPSNNYYSYNRKVQQPKPYKSYGYKPVTAKPYAPPTYAPYVAPAKTEKPTAAPKPTVAPRIVKPVAPTTTVAPRIVTTAKPFTVRPVPAVPVTKSPAKLVSKPIENQIEEEETVLDFSSGSAQEVENTATEVKKTETIETTNGFEILTKGYEKLGLDEELAGIGNITIFAPRDDDFKKAVIDIDRIDDRALRALILKHLVKGTLERKDLKGQVQTLAGVPITLTKDDKGKLIIISNGKTTKLKITNVRTKWGIVHVIDSVLA